MRADLGIITLSRTPEHFARLAASLDKQLGELPKCVHVLVNNASGRHQVELDRLAVKHGWFSMTRGYNTTFSEGNNLGAKLARKAANVPYLLLLNDDVSPRPDFLATLWENRHSGDVTGCLLVHGDGTVNHAGSQLLPYPDHLGRGDPEAKWLGGCVPVYAVTFAVALIRHETWEALGGLDERYSYGFEDTDFCVRVLQRGGIIMCNRDAVAAHEECGTRVRGGKSDKENARLFYGRFPVAKLRRIVNEYVERVA